MDKRLLGQILATIVTSAALAGEIALDSQGKPVNGQEVSDLIEGFLSIWKTPGKGFGAV